MSDTIWTRRGCGWHRRPLPSKPKRMFGARKTSLDSFAPELDWACNTPAGLGGGVRANWPRKYDQQQTSSCVGQGLKREMHTAQIVQGNPTIIEPSSLFIYWNARDLEGATATDGGANIIDGFASLVSQGFCSEGDWVFDPACVNMQPSPTCYANAQALTLEDYEPAAIDNTDLQVMIEALNQAPIVGGIVCFDSFQSEQTIRTGIVPMPGASENEDGGHCMFYRGYSMSRRTFLFDNSWGMSYGVNGSGEIPFDYLTDGDWASDFHVALKVG